MNWDIIPWEMYKKFCKYIFKLILRFDILNTSYEMGFSWLPQNFVDDKSKLIQVMAENVDPDLCRHMASHELILHRVKFLGNISHISVGISSIKVLQKYNEYIGQNVRNAKIVKKQSYIVTILQFISTCILLLK